MCTAQHTPLLCSRIALSRCCCARRGVWMFRGQDIPQIMQVPQFFQPAVTTMLSTCMADAANFPGWLHIAALSDSLCCIIRRTSATTWSCTTGRRWTSRMRCDCTAACPQLHVCIVQCYLAVAQPGRA